MMDYSLLVIHPGKIKTEPTCATHNRMSAFSKMLQFAFVNKKKKTIVKLEQFPDYLNVKLLQENAK